MTIANRLTIARVALAPIYIGLLYWHFPGSEWVAMSVFILASITDFLDGYLARSRNQVTNFGVFMDSIADKLLVVSALIVLTSLGRMHALVCAAFVARDSIVSGVRQVAATQQLVVSASWLGKIKMVVQIVLVCVLTVNNVPFSMIGLRMDLILTVAALALALWSAAEYVYKNRKALNMGAGA